MMPHPIFLSLMACLLIPAAPFASAEPVGRLFLTAQQRQSLERVRQGGIAESKAEAATVKPADSDVTLDGYVKRNGSRESTVWINSMPRRGADNSREIALVSAGKKASVVTLKLPSGRNVRLKAGQSIDAATGRILDVFESGVLVSDHTAPPAAPGGR